MTKKTGLIAALDAPDLKKTEELLKQLNGLVDFYKVGSGLFTAAGPAAIELALKYGKKVFLDLKFHDIPNTVASAVKSAASLGVYSVSVHLSGGAEMLKVCAALEKKPKLWGITVLTSLDENELFRAGFRCGILKTARGLAALGAKNGADGVVCSPLEAAAIKKIHGENLTIITPGVRLPKADAFENAGDDQKRILTPKEAAAAGADFIVVGRPIINAEKPAAAAAAFLEALK
ncbi:MAG: orotidine 5'-phosphate decarboxylase [Elusimicrobia bacterium GWC2_51_8]|nr:MAG: orotidine 5'-phosphate decarboxylase [Elusimicrobia bacterium GWA2_51_34]OGR60384.1 MAG: orotidine 5'-phosphate decarboxylase [Elusimicrobia bacterium GWC2_51_8]OGR86834.1 MAG: orotidine 5'-phosphate decarboxylase [Elusimicrobia bacterium GWF2_52_66]HAF94770.1 orotidine-5'-phosphate decarboxylase [Elusimicrobiota bacterium]HCE99016.1 orotidine-5'-phosphate decarboxylase [Elusimicrobiota bacterium]